MAPSFGCNRNFEPGLTNGMGSEKFSNSAKSGYNKGTLRSDIRYLVVSKDVRRHRLISIYYITTLPVTAEVASSSLVVPAISFHRVRRISLKPSKGAKRARFAPFLCPFQRPAVSYSATSAPPSLSEEKTSDITAACAACFAVVTAWV